MVHSPARFNEKAGLQPIIWRGNPSSLLATGQSPNDSDWIIHWSTTNYSHSLGSLPRTYSEDQKDKVNEICSKADLSTISSHSKFPDWLGYLGLILVHMHSDSESFENLSRSWAFQLSKLVQTPSQTHSRLSEIARGDGLLNISDLEACEVDILRNKWSTIHPT